MRRADSIPIVSTSVCFLPLKMYTPVLQKSLSLMYKRGMFYIYNSDLLRHLVAFSKFERFLFSSSDHKIKIFSTHFVHKP